MTIRLDANPDGANQHVTAARAASNAADRASETASTRDEHDAAAVKHDRAAALHDKAGASGDGQEHGAAKHRHEQKAKEHRSMAASAPAAARKDGGAVFRIDASTLRSPTKSKNGWLRADGLFTRAGIFEYRNSDGSTRREYRPEDEVFHADSLASFQMVPLTNDHPASGLLDAETATAYSVGSVGENIRRDGDHVAGSVLVTDKEVVDAVLSGKADLSCGYTCDYDPTPGEHPTLGSYHGTQRNIRGNHLAIVSHGRAGSARLRLDSGDAVMTAVPRTDTEPTMKMKVNGVDIDVPDTIAALVQAEQATHKVALDAAHVRADKAEGERDAAKADAAARADAADPKKLDARVNARVGLLLGAQRVLGVGERLDGKSDRQVQEAVLAKLVPAFKPEAFATKSDVYISARYDAELERIGDRPIAEALIAVNGGVLVNAEHIDADADPEEVAKAKQRKDSAGAWQKPTK